MGWKFYIMYPKDKALNLCSGRLDQGDGDGRGYGWGDGRGYGGSYGKGQKSCQMVWVKDVSTSDRAPAMVLGSGLIDRSDGDVQAEWLYLRYEGFDGGRSLTRWGE